MSPSPNTVAAPDNREPSSDRSLSVPGPAQDRRLSVPGPSPALPAKLDPTEFPGRITRKARQFEAEIARLRALGYTLDAIRRTLAAAGVQVSLTTVRRELSRSPASRPLQALAAAPLFSRQLPGPAAGPTVQPSPATPAQPAPPSGKDLAAAFRHRKSSNPLIRAKEAP